MTDDTKNDTKNIIIRQTPINSTNYHVYLLEHIRDAGDYVELFETLRNATLKDSVTFHINCFGGFTHTTIQIIHAMRKCKSKITTIIEGVCYSGGSIVFLAGDTKIVEDLGEMMIHDYSGGICGKGNDIITGALFGDKQNKKFSHGIYKGFLTKSEIDKCIEGKDYWFDKQQIDKRLKQHEKLNTTKD